MGGAVQGRGAGLGKAMSSRLGRDDVGRGEPVPYQE